MRWLTDYYENTSWASWSTLLPLCCVSDVTIEGRSNFPTKPAQGFVIYTEQPRPGQPLKMDFDSMRPNTPRSNPTRPPTRNRPTLSLWPTTPKSKKSKDNSTWQPLASSISSPHLIDFSIPQPETPRRRRRLQRRRRPEALKSPASPSQHIELRLLRPRSELPALPSPEENFITNLKRYYTPTMSLSDFLSRTESSSSLSNTFTAPGKSITRIRRKSSRYSMTSDCSSISPTIRSKSDSIYRKAVIALPQSPQYFLDSLDDNSPKPPVPLKIRPYSKASTVAHRHSKLCGQVDAEGVREWDMGWEDFDTILDQWKSGFEEDETTGLCTKGSSVAVGPASGVPSPMERWRSRWSSSTSGSSKVHSTELSIPAVAHLPDLESDTISDPSSPLSHGPRTPFLLSKSPPPPILSSRISHISQCLTEPEPKTPTSRYHGASQSADAAYYTTPYSSKMHEKPPMRIILTPRERFYADSRPTTSYSSLRGQDSPVLPHYLGLQHQGVYHDLKRWPREEDFGVPF